MYTEAEEKKTKKNPSSLENFYRKTLTFEETFTRPITRIWLDLWNELASTLSRPSNLIQYLTHLELIGLS